MTVGLYQKRPVTVEAVQWTGDNLEAALEYLERWANAGRS